MEYLNVVKLVGIALIVVLALSLGVGAKTVQAATLFGLAHLGKNGPSTLYTIDTTDGKATEIGPTGFERCSGMDFRAGTLFATCERANGSDTHVLIMIDLETGIGAEVGPTGIETLLEDIIVSGRYFETATDISFQNSGELFAYLQTVDDAQIFPFLARIDIAAGSAVLTRLPNFTNTFGNGNGIAISPGDKLFHADERSLNTLNQTSGVAIPELALDLVFPPNECPNQSANFDCRVNAMDFNLDGTLFASVNHKFDSAVENFLATIETKGDTTVAVTIIGPTVDGLDAIAFGPAASAPPAPPAPPGKAELGDLKCYEVKRPRETPKFEDFDVTLNDRFDVINRNTHVEKVETICTPVVGQDSTAPSSPSFTCYKIKDKGEHVGEYEEGQPKFQQLDVTVGNELYGEGQVLTLKKPKVICVPSTIDVH